MSGWRAQWKGLRRLSLAILIVVLLLSIPLVARLRQPRGDEPADILQRIPRLGRSTVTLTPGLHYLGRLFPSVVYAIETSDGLVLIDSGLKPDALLLRQELAGLGLDDKRVRAILLTHVHGDHSGGAAYLRAETGATVYAGRDDAMVLRQGGPREAFFSTFDMPDTAHPTPVDVELSGDEVLTFGAVRIQALSTPGHTPGSTCYLLERGALRAMFTGDVIMKLSEDDPPLVELGKPLGTYAAYLAPAYRGDPAAYLASLRRLRSLPAPQLVLPGHPVADSEPQSPCFLQPRWEALLDAGIRDMEQLVDRYRNDGADFLDDSPKELLPDLFYLGEFSGSSAYGLFASGKFYLVNTPAAPGLLAFLADRLGRLGRPAAVPAALLLTSVGPAENAGLGALGDAWHPRVVAPRAGLPAIRKVCPGAASYVASEDLAAEGWFPVTTVPLAGRGETPVAYMVPWKGKKVLFTGRIPVAGTSPARKALIDDFRHNAGDPVDYLQSLARLENLNPDLWLPAVPANRQNANLYGAEWKHLIEDNQSLVKANRWTLTLP